jgi:hypothetical protein
VGSRGAASASKALSAGPRRKGPSKRTQKKIVARFRRTGGAETWQGRRDAPPANTKIGFREDMKLLKVLADSPGDMLDEILARQLATRPGPGVSAHRCARGQVRLPELRVREYAALIGACEVWCVRESVWGRRESEVCCRRLNHGDVTKWLRRLV